jgi:hypothetical protein
MNEPTKLPRLKQRCFYWPSSSAPQGPTGAMAVKESAQPMKAAISAVHNARLVDLAVTDHAGAVHAVRFVPFLHDGDPDPKSPAGRCQSSEEREGPAVMTLNPGTAQEFKFDPNSGETSGHPAS